MKKISLTFLVISTGVIIYYLIKEQLKGIHLSPAENRLLSITYLVVGICLFMLFRLKHLENKKGENPKK